MEKFTLLILVNVLHLSPVHAMEKFTLLILVNVLHLSPVHGSCQFPREWAGRWFQSGVPHLISVNATVVETKGRCVESDGDKFVIEDRTDNCYRCVVIHEKHPNVLQYKETYCDRADSLANLCNLITGDASLFSMFRADAAPTPCPFKGGPPFTFTYNRGSGDCASPVSRVEACTQDSRMLLRYQACPDVHGTESAVEELVCLAWWKDGSTRYLVGKLRHALAHTDEDRYRCFVFERGSNPGPGHERHGVYYVAQSGDATCNGLVVATEGSRTMRLAKADGHPPRCRYPHWVTAHPQWHSLDSSHSLHVSPRNATLRMRAGAGEEMRVVCHSLLAATDTMETVVAHLTTGCQSGYVCMVFYRRDGHVIELQHSATRAEAAEDACDARHFNPATLPYVTLITPSPHPRQCPYLGRYSVQQAGGVGGRAPPWTTPAPPGSGHPHRPCNEAQAPPTQHSHHYESLAVGCMAPDTMEFTSTCTTEAVSAYSCHGTWQDNGTSYLIAAPVSRKSVGARRYCFIYTEGDVGGALQVASVTESCRRNMGGTAVAWAFTLTPYGQCGERSVAAPPCPPVVPAMVLMVLVLSTR